MSRAVTVVGSRPRSEGLGARIGADSVSAPATEDAAAPRGR